MRIYTVFVTLLAGLFYLNIANSTVPETDVLHPIIPSNYSWKLVQQDGQKKLEIVNFPGKKVLKTLDISDCMFCSGEEDNCDIDGIFNYANQQLNELMLGVVCHVGAHSQRFELFKILQDTDKPVLSLTGEYYIDFDATPEGIEVRFDKNKTEKSQYWPKHFSLKKQAHSKKKFNKPLQFSGSAISLKRSLDEIVKTKNIEALKLLLAKDVVIDLGGMTFTGKNEFIRFWNLESSEDSELWDWISKLLKVGAIENNNTLEWPYIPNRPDIFRVALRSNVAIHAGPNQSSPVLGYVDHATLNSADDAMNGFPEMIGWSAVTTPTGIYGFVSHENSIDPSDDRMKFIREEKQWKLIRLKVREH